VRPPPNRVERLPQQYFTALLGRVSAAAALDGEPLVDLGRGNPEVGPPQHVIDALSAAANEPAAHGYPPFRGLPELREAIAARYSAVYGVELDPHSEVTIVPGTKTAICELAMVLAEGGSTIVLPDPYYPDYPSGPALAGARTGYVPLDRSAGWAPLYSANTREVLDNVSQNFTSIQYDFFYN
jgi:aminotransferase